MNIQPKIRVGVLGATGAVGQRFVQMLQGHPWFELSVLCASQRNAGKRYADACNWLLRGDMPPDLQDIILEEMAPGISCRVVFSALPSGPARTIEAELAAAGYIVCSNASAYRYEPDVPLLIPEVNPEHLGLIDVQRKWRVCAEPTPPPGPWRSANGRGFITTNPNCSTTHLVSALHPLHEAFGVEKVFAVTMQAVSGAGYSGVTSMDIIDNVVPFIGSEEEKMEHREPQKLLGRFDGQAVQMADFVVSAHCNRVPVRNGHLAAISVAFARRPSLEDVRRAWAEYDPLPQRMGLPSAPEQAILYREETDRPQPRMDRLAGSVPGMTTVVGRLREDPLLHVKFLALGHNTIRGAAGGSLLNAELLAARGYLNSQEEAAGNRMPVPALR